MLSPRANLVLTNGRVYTGLRSGFTEAVALWSDKVLAAGSSAEIQALVGPHTSVVDLQGRTATPGINDGHQHLLPFGLGLSEVNLSPTEVRSLDEVLQRVRRFVERARPGEWIFGGRYDHFELDVKRHPLRAELDRVAPDNPVYLKRTCGHMGVGNSLALRAAGIDAHTAQPEGGYIEFREGEPTGLLQERAQELISRVMPKLSREQLIRGIEDGGKEFHRHGITSVMDAGVGLRQGFDDYRAYIEARRQRRLPVRCYMALLAADGGVAAWAEEHGFRTGAGDEYLKVGPAKFFTDGSAGGKTAAMSQPYRDSNDNLGILIYQDQELYDFVAQFHDLGFQIAIHAIGDAAIDQTLRALQNAGKRGTPIHGRRHRVEHCGFTTPEQMATMREFGMIPAPQPIFIYEFGDLYMDVLGEERPQRSYPMRRWIDAGLHPVASSDTPVSSYNPMQNLYAMITRKTNRGTVLGAEEIISREEAVSAMTYNGAYGSFSETVKGTLAPGMLADVAVWERDIFAALPEEILETRCDLTVLDGRVVYDRRGEFES